MPDGLSIQLRVHEVFEEIAQRYPESDAVVCGQERVRYQELSERSSRLARLLIHQGVAHEEPVGVALPKSCGQVGSVLFT